MQSDLRHAWRTLRRSPAGALAAIVSLTVALGAGTTIAAVIDRTLRFASRSARIRAAFDAES